MLLLFFHTLFKHGHIAPDYRLQNHIHASFPQRRTNTDAARVRRALHGNPPLLILGWRLKADTSLSSPSWSNFLFFLYFFEVFLAKSKFVQPQKSDVCVPQEDVFCQDAHAYVTTWFLHDLLFIRPVLLCGDPLPELASDIPSTHKKRKRLGRVALGFTSALRCLTSPSWAWISAITCLLKGVCVCVVHNVSVQVHKV